MENEKDEGEIQDNPRFSVLAIMSALLAVISPFTYLVTAIPALVLGIVSLLEMGKNRTGLKGKSFAVIGIAIPSVVIMLVTMSVMAGRTGNFMLEIARNRKKSNSTNLTGISRALEIYGNGSTQSPAHDIKMKCSTNMSALAKAMQTYFNQFDQYPTGEKWCDLLIEKCKVERKSFRCPGAKEGPCNYAVNKYATELEKSAQGDIVVLFESQPGWNQVGGPELLTTENHEGDGCNVAFSDSSVKFIYTRDLKKLKWRPEAKE